MSKKMLHSNFNFALVNIFPKHSNIPLQNNKLKKITEYTIHT